MADPTARGTLGFDFKFFATSILQWTVEKIRAQAQRSGFSSKITGQETVDELKGMYPGCVVVGADVPFKKQYFLLQQLVDYLRQKGLHVNDIDQEMIPRVPQDPALRQQQTRFVGNATDARFHRWSVTDDDTVNMKGTFDPRRHQPRDTYLESEMKGCSGVEIVSPALTDTPESYQEVARVFNMVKNLYFLHVNESCGLHVHVAFGPHTITMEPLRKIACLLFTLDPFIATLHPEHRTGGNPNCPSIRKYSNAARGWTFKDAVKDLNRIRMGEDDEYDPLYYQMGHKAGGNLEWVPIPDALDEIKACKKPEEVAWLLQCEARANYNFCPFHNGTLNPTIEFREHAMTGDVARVIAWGRFCVALVRYAALEMSDGDLEEIVEICHDAESEEEDSKFKLWELFEFMDLQDSAVDLRVSRPPA
ncbi:hypothetical protein PG994_014023 [Apiospora phragmitis]|uniref:Amidoligase enzyme-domain-containing protein n=1 Tax=Apiospora phragmitis TaxID=2905665 RepID=A0ABR1T4P4_9PEZI